MTSLAPEEAYSKVEALVTKFKSLPVYTRRAYNEADTRKDFILPLFHSLGWDTFNAAEVSAEERVSRNWVDFAFRLSGIPRFFLETKRVAEDLDNPRWVKQAIDYAWTKNVAWAMLSDFERLRVFNAEWKEENPLRAQFLEWDIDSYLADFERLWWISRSEMANGKLDREAEKVGKKLHKEPVSQRLFDDLKTWRSELVRHLIAYNSKSPAQIDEAVLRILNRLIFIRTVEDRGVEPPRLQPLVRELRDRGQIRNLTRELAKLFRELDAIYDSDLFAEHFSEKLDCEPEPFIQLIDGLHEKRGGYVQYNFNAIDTDVLGTAYEQYLGHVVGIPNRMDPGLQPAIVEKRAKRKAQGIYYTPTFVAKYIVERTLGRYLSECDLERARSVRLLDLAAGSGSFLIQAFEIFARHFDCVEGTVAGLADRLAILSHNLYGVDKDAQAVSVAKLNLAIKAVRERRRLPMLENIRQGDSLVSGSPEELRSIFGNIWQKTLPFDWEQQFPDVMAAGGFDVVVSNPPYVRQETLGDEFKIYAQRHFVTFSGTADYYTYFIERAMSLLRPGGMLGFIVANKWMRAQYGEPLRRWLRQQCIEEIIDFGDLPVFQQATTYPCILILRKQVAQPRFQATSVKTLEFVNLEDYVRQHRHEMEQMALGDRGWSLAGEQESALLEKIRSREPTLGQFLGDKVYFGIKTGLNAAFIINRKTRAHLIAADAKSRKLIKPYRIGRDVKRYQVLDSDRYLIMIPDSWTSAQAGDSKNKWKWLQRNYPAIAAHLEPWAEAAERRCDKGEHWWELRPCDYYARFAAPKIVYPSVAQRGNFTLDGHGMFFDKTCYFIPSGDLYLLGLLNSKLLFFYFAHIGVQRRGGYFEYLAQYVSQLPIHSADANRSSEQQLRDRIAALAAEMLSLQNQFTEASRNLEDRRHSLQQCLEQNDRSIDEFVYQLYGLNAGDIETVEKWFDRRLGTAANVFD